MFYSLSKPVYAMQEDSNQPLELKSNFADINNSNHIGRYEGDVALDQGSTHIRANMATTHSNENNKLIKAVISGEAHYWTKISPDKSELHAYAEKMYYYPEKHIIKLVGHAKVTQENNSYQAPIIIYNTANQHISSSNSKMHKNERVRIVFHHKVKNNE
ncbi:MAG: lipopolysaccharide transport periplasmic protein LptA [Legionellales bacterium RIFCSPHIGHO2_12_FULL_35_11]|nr:MAG: lipopolysaccharide transport periplasmic protein LptA [Legionellales bacterium RIFCSPHIGHO2_12_FULL_35_11]